MVSMTAVERAILMAGLKVDMLVDLTVYSSVDCSVDCSVVDWADLWDQSLVDLMVGSKVLLSAENLVDP